MENNYSNKYVIETAIGLQDVDGLKNSPYFLDETSRYIRGEITLDELDQIITSYYKNKPDEIDRSEEADKVSIRIARIISEDSFTFSVGQLLTIHRLLFQDILENAGHFRSYNFSKKEWVLDGASVTYGDYRELEMTLQYDFEEEKKYHYNNLSIDETIEHLALFTANLWQIHPFEEGNTRTTAVFLIKYLRSLGFNVTNDIFSKNAWYFRNALVRANYTNISKGIYEDRSFLIAFLRNLLLKEKNQLKNKDLHIKNKSIKQSKNKDSRIVELMLANPKITTNVIASTLGISSRTVKSLIKTLTIEKIIKRVHGKRYGYWSVTKR